MNMEHGMNERIQRLRKQSVTTDAFIDMERARFMTQLYQEKEGSVSTPELRGMMLRHYFENKTLYIGDGELIVGEKGCRPLAAPTFPELCCHTLEDMDVMDSRDLISFRVSKEAREYQESHIIPYWEHRSIRSKIVKEMPKEWQEAYESGIFTEFMEQRGPGHTVGGEVIYHKGFIEQEQDIDQAIEALDFVNDPDALEKRQELLGMKYACQGMMALGDRYAAYATELASKETDVSRQAELLQIAENCKVVPRYAPKTYWQAIQMYWFVHLGVTSEINPWDAFSPGRLDQHLIGFYQKDLEEGTLTREAAKELLECLWIKFNNQPAPPKVGITLKESSTYTDFANINTGGITPDGQDGVNDVSYLILECMDDMQLLQPSSNVQISRKTPQKFLKEAAKISRKGWGQPAFYNTDAIVQELLNAGKTIQDARRGGSSGCVETGAFGNEAYILTGYFNIPKIFELTLYQGYDHVSGRQLGPKTRSPLELESFQELFDCFMEQMDYFLNIKILGNNIIEKIYSKYMPVPFLSVITNDCIAKGRDYNSGGARYNTSYIQGVGIGTITDCLSAIKYLVFEEKKITMEELLQAMKANFQGHEHTLHLVKNRAPRYGNDDDRADDLMVSVFENYVKKVTSRRNLRGGTYGVNMLPTTCHIYFGEVMMASANGRLAHLPVSEGISPEKGADRKGPTAVIKSCAKMDHLKTGGTLLNQKFTPSVVEGDLGLEHMANLVRSYFNMDGHHIQFNVIDRDTLIQAQQHPEENKDLIVRVAGYSDHFRNLSKALQDEIIGRTEQRFH